MKRSLKVQFAITFICLTTGTILLCLLLNSTLLGKYYLNKKQSALLDAYRSMNEASAHGDITGDEFDLELQLICEKYNISVLVADNNTKTVKASMNDPEMTVRRLLDNIFAQKHEENILKETDLYTIQRGTDQRTQTEYMEMWGVLDNGYLFLMRSALTAIEENVAISNRFLAYVGIISIAVSVLFGLIFSKKITGPILKLADISEKMKQLEFEAKYTGNDRNEIGILGRNINELSETLENTISELKTANNELIKDIQQKDEIDEMRKEFLSNVSHELKTPIAIIQGYAEGLKEGINDDAYSKEFYCDVIMDEANKMNTMVKKLMTLNQLESGSEIVNLERFDIVTMIKNYIESAEVLLKQKAIQIRMEPYESTYVWGDEFRVEEVFSNYFTNAIHHCDAEKVIDIKLDDLQDTIKISVFNTGEKIPEDSIEHIWDKFYKVDKARTRAYGGSGIGLSIVKAIMESLNQPYGVCNYDNGVEFWFCLDKAGM